MDNIYSRGQIRQEVSASCFTDPARTNVVSCTGPLHQYARCIYRSNPGASVAGLCVRGQRYLCVSAELYLWALSDSFSHFSQTLRWKDCWEMRYDIWEMRYNIPNNLRPKENLIYLRVHIDQSSFSLRPNESAFWNVPGRKENQMHCNIYVIGSSQPFVWILFVLLRVTLLFFSKQRYFNGLFALALGKRHNKEYSENFPTWWGYRTGLSLRFQSTYSQNLCPDSSTVSQIVGKSPRE